MSDERPIMSSTACRAQPERFVQLARQLEGDWARRGVNAVCEDLLANLALEADWRKPHRVPSFRNYTDYARRLGAGPSARRALARRLDVLLSVGAVRWRAGFLELVAYGAIVHGGRDFEQVRPDALDRLCVDRAVTIDQRFFLLRLIRGVDPGTAAVMGAPITVAKRLRVDRDRCRRLIEELAHRGIVRIIERNGRALGLELLVYNDLIQRLSDGAVSPEARNRARSTVSKGAKSRGPRREIARPEARNRAKWGAETRDTTVTDQGIQAPLYVEGVYNPRPIAATAAARLDESTHGDQGQGQGDHHQMLGQLAQQLPTHVGRLLIEEPGYEPARRALTSNLASLAELVGLEKALTDLAADWPADVHHPAAWASKRAARRLAEAHADAELVEQHVNTDAERREANRMAALRHAENLARTDVDEPMAIAHLQSSYGRSELWAEVEARFRERRGATRLPTAEHRAPNQADARRAAWAALETGRAAGKLRMSHPASTMADVAEPTEMAS